MRLQRQQERSAHLLGRGLNPPGVSAAQQLSKFDFHPEANLCAARPPLNR
jgi:hypothetical protein